jgi:hypothetical protein
MKEESQHAVLDEMEWMREDAMITPAERDKGVTELIELVGAVDGLLQMQAGADAEYFVQANARKLSGSEAAALRESCSPRTAGSTSSRASRTSASCRSSRRW